MTSRLIQNVTASKNPQQQDLLSDGKSADELLQETINLPAEDIEAIEEESITDNQLYKGITFSANLDAKLKNEVAIFYVVDEDGQYRVRAFNAVQRMLDTGSNQPPIVSFSQQMEGENSSEKLRDIPAVMRLYSQKRREAKQIIKWLVELQKRLTYDQQELSYVVINDKTDFEIPWEMLEWHKKSESDEKIHHYLGASFITVRWQDIENLECWDEDENLLNLEFEPEDCTGNIIAYTNTTDFQSVEQEISTLLQFNATYHKNPYDFLDELEKIKAGVSLVYIASHGFFHEDIYETSIGENDIKKRVTLKRINKYNLDCFKACPSIVFMNACHSGRLRKDSMMSQDYYRTGFATFFLERGARGVIGTLGKVIDQYAVKVSHNFFAECQRSPGISVAAILRNIRKQIAEIYKERKDDETERLFIITFMYVYYGNPMTVLRLPKTGGG